MSNHKLQSAMEYLMTYGWAILIIAIVLGALYQLGVFGNARVALSSSCLAAPGFLCQNPILNSSGWLGVKFGHISSGAITITGNSCTTNTTTPVSTQGLNLQIVPTSTAVLVFNCPISSNAIGTSFSGYLWITYSTSTQSGLITRFATVTGKVATAGNVIAALGGGTSAGGPALFTATGGTVTFSGGNEIHTFTSNGVFTVTGGSGNIAALVVGGGGGGGGSGNCGGGGGGGGGVVYNGNFAISPSAYSITIGSGGAPGVSFPLSGSNSIFSTLTAVGGGGGGPYHTAGGSGGSGGGGGDNAGAGSSTAGQGNNGGTATDGSDILGGGGGGAGAVGGSSAGNNAGSGGAGISSSISGAALFYGGGGGGGAYNTAPNFKTPGSAGSGGGGAGGGCIASGGSGTANTGGGGGGANGSPGTGGSGIVIISFNQLGNGTP